MGIYIANAAMQAANQTVCVIPKAAKPLRARAKQRAMRVGGASLSLRIVHPSRAAHSGLRAIRSKALAALVYCEAVRIEAWGVSPAPNEGFLYIGRMSNRLFTKKDSGKPI